MSRKRPKHSKRHEHHEKHEAHAEHEKHEKHEKHRKADAPKSRKKAEDERFLKRIFGDNKKPLALVAAIFFIIGILVGYVFIFSGAPVTGMAVDKEEVGAKAVKFINDNIATGVVMVSVEENSGIYTVMTSYQGNDIPVYATTDGTLLVVGTVYDMNQVIEPPEQPTTTLGNFIETSDAVCEEDGKPIIYFFGSEGCPHCKWEHPIVEAVAEKFEGYISFHNNMDTDADRDVFSRYSTGGIPTTVLGCKYYRQGSGESIGEAAEEAALTQLICSLTNNQPEDVCSQAASGQSQIDEGELAEFIDCLKDSDFKIYGANWCGWTKKLVTMLGGFDMIEPIYIECTEQKEECDSAGVGGYPTIIVNGQKYQGDRTFEAFSGATGCPVPSGAEAQGDSAASTGDSC